MLFSMYIIKNALLRTEAIEKYLNSKEDIEDNKSKVYGLIYDLYLVSSELNIGYKDDFQDYLYFLEDRLDNVENAKTIEDLKVVLDRIKKRFSIINIDRDDYYSLNEYYKDFNYYNNSLDETTSNIIASHIKSNRKFNVFDTACKDGKTLESFKSDENALLYGLEKNSYLAEDAKKIGAKVIKGELKGSRISNDSFDVLFSNCPMKFELKDNMLNGAVIKKEKQFIQNTTKYLKADGVMIITLPYYRLYKDMCTLIAKTLDNIVIFRKKDNQDESLYQVCIVGTKSNNKDVDIDNYNKLRQAGIYYDKLPTVQNVKIQDYNIEGSYTDIEFFKGSVLDMEELLNIAETSGCYDSFFENQKVDKIYQNPKQPLLPFNVGQIGLVLTSGCLDGIIDEGDGHYHLVKGKVSKQKDSIRDVSAGILEETETISNKVEINVLLPNGDFKTLA